MDNFNNLMHDIPLLAAIYLLGADNMYNDAAGKKGHLQGYIPERKPNEVLLPVTN